MRLYGKFLVEILNDKESGELLLAQSRKIMTIKLDKKNLNFPGFSENNITSLPTILISTD